MTARAVGLVLGVQVRLRTGPAKVMLAPRPYGFFRRFVANNAVEDVLSAFAVLLQD